MTDFIAYKAFVDSHTKHHEGPQDWLNGPIGMAKESGELLDNVYRHWHYGKDIDQSNIIEECGDVLFYMQASLSKLGCTVQDAMMHNTAKLGRRYPEGKFTEKAALERADKLAEQDLHFDKDGREIEAGPVNEWLHEEPSPTEKDATFKCQFCGKGFTTGQALGIHYSTDPH